MPFMLRRSGVAVALVSFVAALSAQTPAGAGFEVVSIHRHETTEARFRLAMTPGHYTAVNVSLFQLLLPAYQFQRFQMDVGPSWVMTKKFDFEGTIAGGGRFSRDELSHALQLALQDRFALKTHVEKRTQTAYELFVPDGMVKPPGAARTQPDPGGQPLAPGQVFVGAGEIAADQLPIERFAAVLSSALGSPVVDRTGLSQPIDVRLRWSPGPGERAGTTGSNVSTTASDTSAPAVSDAIREQLGLGLRSTKTMVDFLVVDHVETPSEN
jgi:uncharacterized protein (TIGR03435 family)